MKILWEEHEDGNGNNKEQMNKTHYGEAVVNTWKLWMNGNVF